MINKNYAINVCLRVIINYSFDMLPSIPQFRHIFKTVRHHGHRSDAVQPVVERSRHAVLRVHSVQPGASGARALCDRHTAETGEIPFAQSMLLRTVRVAVLSAGRNGGGHRMGRGNVGVQHCEQSLIFFPK